MSLVSHEGGETRPQSTSTSTHTTNTTNSMISVRLSGSQAEVTSTQPQHNEQLERRESTPSEPTHRESRALDQAAQRESAADIPLPESAHTSVIQGLPEAAHVQEDEEPSAIIEEVELEEEVLEEEAQDDSTMSITTVQEEESTISARSTIRSRSDSSGTLSSNGSALVDWDELDRSEEQAPRNEGSDESTAFLLARLEQENDALATDPKAKLARARSQRKATKTRPPSMQQLKRMVNEPTKPSLRYSIVPDPPPMTELEFWAALVNDYPQTAQRLPTLTSNKIRGGVPPPLRGVVWMSIAGSRDRTLEEEYNRLCGETSPYENLIGKDIGRSFPGVEMFRDPSGDGQQMLGRVLKCFSLYDDKIGYCQGLGFVVGPLIMHMADKEAFCVLVRLMEHYDLRACFLPDLSGLHLRIYQFQKLLAKHHSDLATHLEHLGVEPLYLSQWFLSFFAITCPLPMLLRIYDVILTEGASETLMRVALSLMRRNESKLLACTELEDAMGLLLGRALWDTYGCNADELVNDFEGLTGLVTRDSLEQLERSFKSAQDEETAAKAGSLPNVQAAASRFLGRFWAGSSSSSAKVTSPTSSLTTRPTSTLHRTPSKQSMASTLNSIESAESQLTASTEATAMSMSRNVSSEYTAARGTGASGQDRDLHIQIEDLLTALSDMQREQSLMSQELQKEREEREEDRAAVARYLEQARKASAALGSIPESEESETQETQADASTAIDELSARFNPAPTSKRSSLLQQTKQEMRDNLRLWKEQYEVESGRSADLSRRLEAQKAENARRVDALNAIDAERAQWTQEKKELEATIADLRVRKYDTESDFMSESESVPATPEDTHSPTPFPASRAQSITNTNTPQPISPPQSHSQSHTLSTPDTSSDTFAKRTSSLGTSRVLATQNHAPLAPDAMLVELVNAKTAEATARQELEEVKKKLDSLRKIAGGGSSGHDYYHGHKPSPSESTLTGRSPGYIVPEPPAAKLSPPAASSGGGYTGFFSGWGKRTASNPAVTVTVADS